MKLKEDQIVVSKVTGKILKVLAIVKTDNISRNQMVVVADTRQDKLGRIYKKPDTSRIILNGSIERRYTA